MLLWKLKKRHTFLFTILFRKNEIPEVQQRLSYVCMCVQHRQLAPIYCLFACVTNMLPSSYMQTWLYGKDMHIFFRLFMRYVSTISHLLFDYIFRANISLLRL